MTIRVGDKVECIEFDGDRGDDYDDDDDDDDDDDCQMVIIGS